MNNVRQPKSKTLDGLEIARQRIALEAQRKTGILNLGGLGLKELPKELFELRHLRILSLGNFEYHENGTWSFRSFDSNGRTQFGSKDYSFEKLSALVTLDLFFCMVRDLSALSGLSSLTSLNCTATDVSDLSALSGLSSLTSLNCGAIEVSNLSALSGLSSLTSLDCSSTLVRDLSALSGLSSLTSLNCSSTQVRDLSALSSLSSLTSLGCRDTQVSDLIALSGLSSLTSLNCSETQVSDLSALSGLSSLTSIDCSASKVSDLSALSGLSSLTSLNFSETQVSDLSALSGLSSLTSIDCSASKVSDLSALSGLSSLTSLNFSETQVSDLSALSGLRSLTSLNCTATQVSDLSALSSLSSLTSLNCSFTQVRDLSALSSLSSMTSLNCSETQVSELSALSGLSSLTSLNCSETQVSDLSALSGLSSLTSIDCSATEVSDLSALSGLSSLASLDCSNTKVTDLDELVSKTKIFYADNLRLRRLPSKLVASPSLEHLSLYQSTIPGIPQEVLSNSPYQDCLPQLRAHLADLEQGAAAAHDVKLIIVGNGRVGKTQIARRLRGLPPEPHPDSTHGISISSLELPSNQVDQPNTRVNLWDFGGQDIYHGTHALFMRTNAIFLLVWTNTSELSTEHVFRGMTFRNFQIRYWLEHIGHLAGFQQPVLILQNQCDTPQDESIPPISNEVATKFSHVQFRAYSALRDRGREGLDQAIQEAIQATIDRRGAIFIGQGRAKVKQKLDAMRAEDQSRPPAERRFRTLTQEHFQRLCQEAGNISSVAYFLEYLHDCGLVFYRPGMFDDQIILDQAWALQAIYTVLDRSGPYKALYSLKGRFSRSILAGSVWQNYTEEEQNLFLSMMQSCGVCFEHRPANVELEIEAEYVAPDLLPTRESVEVPIAAQWDHPGDTCSMVCEYSYHDPSLTRSIIAEIGRRAGDSAVYTIWSQQATS
jgi:internalin A